MGRAETTVRFLTPDELADRYQVPVATVYNWRTKSYGPPGIRVGRHLRYPIAAVEEWERRQGDATAGVAS